MNEMTSQPASTMYVARSANTMADIADFSLWLTAAGREATPVAIALKARAGKLAFSTRDDAWIVDFKNPNATVVSSILHSHLIDHAQLKLVFRNAAHDLPVMCKFFAKELGTTPATFFRAMEQNVVGDLTSAAHVINQVVTPAEKFKRVEHDAYDIALLEPQYSYGIAPYYPKIGLPLAKLIAEAAILAPEAFEWWVSYPHLWVRVLAFYSGDPTLKWAFIEDRDPYATIGAMFNADADAGETILLWLACGADLETFNRLFPKMSPRLPEDLNRYNQEIEKHLPNIWLAVKQMRQAYHEEHSADTRYGRKFRGHQSDGDAVAHRIFGTVEDIVGVAMVTLLTNRPTRDILVMRAEGGPAADTVRIYGAGPPAIGGKTTWWQMVRELATLADPLGQVDLRPTLVVL